MRIELVGFLMVFAFASCATTSKDMNRLSLGMSKGQVIDILGQPDSTGADNDGEFLNYSLRPTQVASWPSPYFVRLKDGKVVNYGPVPRGQSGTGCVTVPLNGMMVTRCNP